MTVEWEAYLDKVYGMIAGATLGAKYAAAYGKYSGIDEVIPALRVVEEKGMNFTPENLADSYVKYGGFISEESAYFRRNRLLGLLPPYTGKTDNMFANNITGSMRAGFWAAMAPANPDMAVSVWEKAYCLDGDEDASETEKYFTVLGSLLFSNKYASKTVKEILVKATEFIDEKGPVAAIIAGILTMFDEKRSMPYITSAIQRNYGNPNKKDYRQNLALIIASLLLGNGDIDKTMKNAETGVQSCCLEYCFNILGQLLGITEGGQKLSHKFGLDSLIYRQSPDSFDQGKMLRELAEDVAVAGLHFTGLNKKYLLTNEPVANSPSDGAGNNIYCTVEFGDDSPCIAPGESKKIKIRFNRTAKIAAAGRVKLTCPEGFSVKQSEATFALDFLRNVAADFTVTMDKKQSLILHENIFTALIEYKNGDKTTFSFGMICPAVYRVYGPFTEAFTQPSAVIHPAVSHSSVDSGISLNEKERMFTDFYSKTLSSGADITREYLEEQLLAGSELPKSMLDNNLYDYKVFYPKDSIISVSDIFGCDGPCVVYLERDIFCPRDMNVKIEIGHSDAFRVWQDGDIVAYSDETEYFTGKNIVRTDLVLRKNHNHFVIKLRRSSRDAFFSLSLCDDISGNMADDILTCDGSYL